MTSFSKVRALLAPDNDVDARLGKNTAQNQPDVEVLAIALKRIPCTQEAYGHMKLPEKDWVHLQFCVVATGPPGFSSAPYLSSKKKGEKDKDTQPLYVSSSKGTVFHPFEKGRTGKDRGRRVEVVDDVNLTAVLFPGVCLTKFLRDENDCFESGRLFVSRNAPVPEEIAENTFVFLQVGVTNAEQAAQGRLLKIKRIMPVEDLRVVGPLLTLMPASAEAHEAVMTTTTETYPSIVKTTIMPNFRVFRLELDTADYVTSDGEASALVSGGGSHWISSKVLELCVPGCTPARARKLLNIALAMDAVTILVRSSMKEEVLSERCPSEVVHLHIDTSRLLLCRSLWEFDMWPDGSSTCLLAAAVNDRVYWMDPTKTFTLPAGEESRLLFELQLAQRTQTESRTQQNAAFLSDGCAGDFYPLRIYTTTDETLDAAIASKVLGMTLQLRPSLRTQAGSMGGKRKRETLQADEFDEMDECENGT